jgi:aminotransferase
VVSQRRFASRSDISVNQITVLNDRIGEMLAKGEDIITLHAGEVGFDTPRFIKDAAYDWLNKGFTHYAPTFGYPELKAAIAEKLAKENGVNADPSNEIQVTQSAAEGIYITMLALLNPGDEMLLLDPYYPSFESCVKMAEGVPVPIPTREEEDWKASPADLESHIGPKTKGIVINSPNNPTGEILTSGDLESIAEVAKRHDLFVVSDEAYEKLVYDGIEHHSIASFPGMKERTITLFSFSKNHQMTGWRLGYVVGPEDFISRANVIHQAVLEHVTSHVQMAGLTALKSSQNHVTEMVRELDRRRRLLVEGLNMTRGIHCKMPKGAFYVFPCIKELGMSSQQFSERLLEEGKVSVTPGTAFGKCGEGYVRIAYSQRNTKEIKKGLDRITSVFGRK